MSAIEDWLRRTDYQESQETEADQGSVSAAHNLAWLNLLKTECSAEDVREDLHAGDTVVKAGRWDPPCVEPATTSPLVSKPLDSFLGADRASYSGAGAGSDNRPLHKLYSVPYHSKPVPLQLSATSHSPSSPGFGITWDEAEHAIEDFTSIFTAHFPFIILDHDITARRLIVEKPLLFLAILMITVDFTTAKSLEIRTSIDAWIGQHLLVMEDQSLGALQGLIVYCAWYTYCESGIRDTANELTRANPHFYSDHRATQLMYLAVGLAHSLGITRYSLTPGPSSHTHS
jgi:hypothetical protein